mgnify:CR=1 FL=1
MAGLFEKDIRLIMQRKNVLMILMLLSVFLAYTQEGTFIVSYPVSYTHLTLPTKRIV